MKIGSDFSGVGAFEQALKRLGISYENIFACDMDKHARQTYIENYGEPKYFPENVYDRIIPLESLDIYMTSPPCQAFSIAGSRKGEQDDRGVLFYNSHEFIKVNNPRYFIFENVRGLMSDDNGKTFQRWIDYLAKSVNGQPVIFPHEKSVNYHIYYKVLNSKDFGVPQNRERIFIIGIRDDKDNNFRFPKEELLTKRLKDVLESEVDEKYYLSEKVVSDLMIDDNKVRSASKKGYEIAREGDSINFCFANSETRRGRIGKGVSQTIETKNTIAVITEPVNATYRHAFEGFKGYNDLSPTIKSSEGSGNQILLNNIRRLTPRECFRLQDFPDSFTWSCSDNQAYKQAGNSITVGVLERLIKKLIYP